MSFIPFHYNCVEKTLFILEKSNKIRFHQFQAADKTPSKNNLRIKDKTHFAMKKNILYRRKIRKSLDLTFFRFTKFLSLIFCLAACIGTLYAQQENVRVQGVITDERGEGLPGVTILVEGTSLGAITNIDGSFELSVSSVDQPEITIVISYIGYITVRETVDVASDTASLNVSLDPDLLSLEEVVVTGTSNPKTKLESSVAISSIKAEDIDIRVPRSNSDLLKAIPGLWVESTGGEGPANVWVRGFPQGGGYEFIGIMEDGLPVFQGGYGTSPSPDQFYKTDLNTKNIEAIRGGTAPIVMQGASGAVINNLSKDGGNMFEGVTKLTYSPTLGQVRADLNVGGPLGNNWFYNAGGFYRSDHGVYDLGYAGNRGGQFKANVKKRLDKGFVKVYGKYINDRVNWNLPTPYIYNKNGDVEDIPGFDVLTDGSSLNKDDTNMTFTRPDGVTINGDLRDGFFTEQLSVGFEFDYSLGDNWSINNKFRIDDIAHNNDVEVIIGITPLAPRPYFYSDGTQISDATNLNGNGLGLSSLGSSSDTDYNNVINRLELINQSERNSLTFGFEYFNFTLDTDASRAVFTKEVTNTPRTLSNPNREGGISPAFTSVSLFNAQGMHRADGTENTYSFYVSNEFSASEDLRIDAAFRIDHKDLSGNVALQNGSSVFAGGSGFIYTEENATFSDDATNWAATIGLNYKLNDNTALFARGSRSYSGIKVGDFTAIGADLDELEALDDREIYQGEVGLKYGSERFALFSSLLWAEVNEAVGSISIPDVNGGLLTQQTIVSTRTLSAEIEAQYKLTDRWGLKLVTTLQNPEYTDYSIVAAPGTIVEGQTLNFDGNTAERVPEVSTDFTVSYAYNKLSGFVNWRYYGDRWSTAGNNVRLKGFSEFYAGIGYDILDNLKFNASVANLFNVVALTEGNTRGDQFADLDALNGQPTLGRRILPRTIFTSLIFEF